MTIASVEVGADGIGRLLVGERPVAAISPGRIDIDGKAVANVGTMLSTEGGLACTGVVDGGTTSIEWSLSAVGSGDVWTSRLRLRNTGDAAIRVTRMDPLAIRLDVGSGHWRTSWFRSAWGDEFRPRFGTTRHDTLLDVRSGRSSHGTVPWLGLESETQRLTVTVSPAWSGNWHIDALADGTVSAGISTWRFAVDLAPGESVDAPDVVLAFGEDLESVSTAVQNSIRDSWLPRTPWSDALPTEWNHWWPYEDVEIDERTIAAEAQRAADLGLEVCTVDAGWFGDSDSSSDWQHQRGDWDRVNTARFPSGLEHLGQSIRETGVQAGIWIEAEAVGRSARLRTDRPDLLALAGDDGSRDPSYRPMTVSLDDGDPRFLGYVCLGSPAGREHVASALHRLVAETRARWVKLDFNIDPDAGCTRIDHGHGPADGLFRHVEGLYAVLDGFRAEHPEVLLEACSSGGLRIDLGLARHVHGFFLSDPDYTEHHLQALMGASRMLPPLGLLHWSHSQWRGDLPQQQIDWAGLRTDAFDTMLRAAMLHRFGVSLRLTELRPDLADRLALHVQVFRTRIAPVVRSGVLHLLTAAPERGGGGERTPVVQLSGSDDSHVLLAVQLDGGVRPESLRPAGLDFRALYSVEQPLADASQQIVSGEALMTQGIPIDSGPETSWLLLINPVGHGVPR